MGERFFSPSRPKLPNDKPCWLGSMVALPSVDVKPLTEHLWEVRVMDGRGAWAIKEIPPQSFPWLMHQWLEDPERALLELFHGRLPAGNTWRVNVGESALSAEELGL